MLRLKNATWLVALYLLGTSLAKADPDTINLSRDLVRLGIASQNLTPYDPSLDARPLFQAAVEYVKAHGTHSVTLDHGAYYFLTPQNETSYLFFNGLSDLTVDLAGSAIYFADALHQGFSFTDCQRFTLRNFKIDFLSPPYTYVTLASLDPAQRTLAYTLLPNWPDPASFNGATALAGPLVLWAAVFREGHIVEATSRMHVAEPIANHVLQLVQDNTPWTQSPTLFTLRPGDKIIVTARGGPPPVIGTRGDSITIADVTVHGSSGFGVFLNVVSNSTVDHVRVMPRPGNLISTNADGIHLGDSGQNNHVRNCFVTDTLDDALAIDSLHLATVLSQNGSRQLTVERNAYLHFPNGTAIHFVDPSTDQELAGATIVSQNPPDSTPPVFDGTVTITFDQDLPALAQGSEMVSAGPDSRGAGSSIENNVVGEVPFGRGIWVGGAEGVKIESNSIGHTSNGAIEVFEDTSTKAYPVPPAHDIVIQGNLIRGSLGPMGSGSGTQIALAAISVVSINATNDFVPTMPNTNIFIRDNLIFDSGRCGIWVGGLDQGAIEHNSIYGYDEYPELPLFGVSPAEATQLLEDFKQPIVVRYSQNIQVSGNVSSQ
ncbi:MAG: right-handed parallel beta-helix repeat-containing protein [Verrucomicrobia bacterium]|nr:right-handed parallel beta-helix repeat-containing protein [Verrucomicrobiota bacterium]